MQQEFNYNPENGILTMPKRYVGKFHNASTDPCDMLIGPCACGSTHDLHEWPMEVREEAILQYPELEEYMETHLAKYPWCIDSIGCRRM